MRFSINLQSVVLHAYDNIRVMSIGDNAEAESKVLPEIMVNYEFA